MTRFLVQFEGFIFKVLSEFKAGGGLCVSGRKGVEVQRGVQKLELAGTPGVQLRAGSETNLVYAVKHNKRTSFRQSLAICTERAQVGPTKLVLVPDLVQTSDQEQLQV